MRKRPKRSPNPTTLPVVLQQMLHLQSVVTTGWRNLSGTEQARFYALTRRLHATPDGALPPGVNAFNTYAQMAYACFFTDMPLPNVCPTLSLCPPLPDIHREARWTADAGLSLTVSADEAYPCALAVWAARPILGGQTPAASTQFGYVGCIPAGRLGPTPFDVSGLYAVRFHVRSAGFQVGLRVMGVNPEGFSCAPQFVWANVVQENEPAGRYATP